LPAVLAFAAYETLAGPLDAGHDVVEDRRRPVMGLRDRLERLRDVDRRRDASYVDDFEASLAEIASLEDAACIGPLLELFEDVHPVEELLWSVVHLVESFPDDVYLRELLRGTPALQRRSVTWSCTLYVRVLNHDPSLHLLGTLLHGQPPDVQAAVGETLGAIERRTPQLAERARAALTHGRGP
jgi:hypothetical protein